MAAKIIILACLVAAVYGQVPFGRYNPYARVSPYYGQYRSAVPYYAEESGPAQYSFQYDVNAPETGDVKSQQEERVDDTVRGSYSFIQPDGLRRIVQYSDEGAGLTAVVSYEDAGVGAYAGLGLGRLAARAGPYSRYY